MPRPEVFDIPSPGIDPGPAPQCSYRSPPEDLDDPVPRGVPDDPEPEDEDDPAPESFIP